MKLQSTKSSLRLLFAILAMIFSFATPVIGQDYQWAFSAGKAHHTQPAAIRKDNSGDLYLATYTDSLTIPLYTDFEKRNAGQQLIWQTHIDGNAAITDVEVNAANHPVVTGYFEGTISIDGNSLTSVPGQSSGFIFETDEAGSLLWIHALNPLNNRFRPKDLFIANDGRIYLTAECTGAGGFCSFHKLDAAGNLLKNEFTFNIDNQRFSHIIADTAGNVYVSGSCGNLAFFDTIAANPAFSYQNFLIKYDSDFNAKWIITKDYITFDDNNKLCTDGKNLYWVYDDYSNINSDTVKIVRVNYNGQALSEKNAGLEIASLPAIDYSVDRAGNSCLLQQAFVHMYLCRYDSLFNIIWQDTLATSTSGNPLHNSLICYDSSFYMLGLYLAPSLTLNNITITNPNAGTSYPSDVFAYKWSNLTILPLSLLNFTATQKEGTILLNWNTQNEMNADKFIVEKSPDGINFKPIGSVEAKNGANNGYTFPDDLASWAYNIVYYRLKQIDRDGRFIFSKIVILRPDKVAYVQIFPDPVTTMLNLNLQASADDDVDISIHSVEGKLIMKRMRKISKGYNLISINTINLPAGNYVVSVKGGSLEEDCRFTK